MVTAWSILVYLIRLALTHYFIMLGFPKTIKAKAHLSHGRTGSSQKRPRSNFTKDFPKGRVFKSLHNASVLVKTIRQSG
jgi:hypothetical protein